VGMVGRFCASKAEESRKAHNKNSLDKFFIQ
jgi:hypothetical protein